MTRFADSGPPRRVVQPPPNQALLAAIVESSDDAIVSKGLDSVITSWNRAAERVFGYTSAEAVGRSVTMIIPDERLAEETTILSRIVRGEKVEHFETERRRKDGRLIPVSLTISPVRGTNGEIIGASKIARDISERRAAEAKERMLTAELDHRVKNMLALVASIAGQTCQSVRTLDEFEAAFNGRLMGLARVHSLLSRSRSRGSTMGEIADQVVTPVCVRPGRCVMEGTRVSLGPNQAIGMALVLQELATNAIKHGSLRGPEGGVSLTWRVEEGSPARLEVVWRETGGGPVEPSARIGYGTQLLDLVVGGDLRGTVERDMRPDGLECTMRFPVEAGAHEPPERSNA